VAGLVEGDARTGTAARGAAGVCMCGAGVKREDRGELLLDL
jgi:hypothetical protein